MDKLIDWNLAWKRVKDDIVKERVFVVEPHELELVEIDSKDWLLNLANLIKNEKFSPSSAHICYSPKIKYGLRPGSHLSIEDRVIYAGIIGNFLPKIIEKLSWSKNIDCSHQLNSQTNSEWLKNPFVGWDNFRTISLKKIGQGVSYVVFCDISAFYENIDIETLISDINTLNVDPRLIDLLRKMLQKWSMPLSSKGIPQGYSSSDILSKIYLDSIDQRLNDFNYNFIRYSDDFRIFTNSLTEARKAVVELNLLLREKGLNIHTAKTEILNANEAKEKIEDIIPILKNVQAKLVRQVYASTGIGNPYMNISKTRAIISKSKNVSVEEVKKAYQTYFIDINDKFNKTLFHFLLNNLGKANKEFAVTSCLKFLTSHPEETKVILDYFSELKEQKVIIEGLINFLNNDVSIYDYQNYLILAYFEKVLQANHSEVVKIARRYSFDLGAQFYTRAICRKLLSKIGTLSDIDRIRQSYSSNLPSLEKAQIICSLKKMEKSKRNYFLSQVKSEGILEERAVRLVKSYK